MMRLYGIKFILSNPKSYELGLTLIVKYHNISSSIYNYLRYKYSDYNDARYS